MDLTSPTHQTIKRQIYRVVLPLLSIAVLTTYWVDYQDGQPATFDALVLPILAVLLLAASLAIHLRKPALLYIENFVYSVLAAVFIGKFATSVYLSYAQASAQQELVQLYVWSPTIFILAYVLFEQRSALRYTASIYTLALAAGLAAAFAGSGGVPIVLPSGLTEFYLSYALYLGVLYSYSFSRTKIAALQAQLAQMERLAYLDPLTGKPNRRALESSLAQAFAAGERYGNPFSLILVDIDRFKQVNDVHGHEAGDKVLIKVADLAATFVRDTDLFGRWGGEEFLILASHTGLEGASVLAERLRRQVADYPFEIGGITASFGVASYQAGDTPNTLIRRADEALYASKTGGRNRVEAFTRKYVERLPLPELTPLSDVDDVCNAELSERLDRGTVRWLARFGIASKRDLYRLVAAIRPGYLASTIHQEASEEVKQLIADWYLWMFFYDDLCDEGTMGHDPARLQRMNARLNVVLAGTTPDEREGPVAQLLFDLGARLRVHGTPEWFARFCATVKAFMAATVWEASNRTRNSPPELASYLILRPVTGGLSIDTAFIELADGVCLPQEVREHQAVTRLNLLADQAVCWANDLFSLNKELHHDDVHNLVLALQREYGGSLPESMSRAAQMYHQAVAGFREERLKRPSFGPADEGLERYLDVLEARIQSNLIWSRMVARYRPTESVPVAVSG